MFGIPRVKIGITIEVERKYKALESEDEEHPRNAMNGNRRRKRLRRSISGISLPVKRSVM